MDSDIVVGRRADACSAELIYENMPGTDLDNRCSCISQPSMLTLGWSRTRWPSRIMHFCHVMAPSHPEWLPTYTVIRLVCPRSNRSGTSHVWSEGICCNTFSFVSCISRIVHRLWAASLARDLIGRTTPGARIADSCYLNRDSQD